MLSFYQLEIHRTFASKSSKSGKMKLRNQQSDLVHRAVRQDSKRSGIYKEID